MSSTVTGIILSLNEDSVGQTVSIRSEADQLTSQLINVTVTGQLSLKSTVYCYANMINNNCNNKLKLEITVHCILYL